MHSKLYLSGIEIAVYYDESQRFESPNCTLVELKFRLVYAYALQGLLQIVP